MKISVCYTGKKSPNSYISETAKRVAAALEAEHIYNQLLCVWGCIFSPHRGCNKISSVSQIMSTVADTEIAIES